jgi:hypothetical protein
MPVFDQRLVRPSVLQLVDCLEQASAEAGIPCDRVAWQELLEGLRTEPEGFRQEGTSGAVSLAWWTDHLHRRHFRVEACDAGSRDYRRVVWKQGWSRPALWHVYPEYTFVLTQQDGWSGVVAACSCGAVGTVERLAWVGDRCHRCHAEGSSATRGTGWDGNTFHRADGKPPILAFSPSGRLVGAASGDPFVDIYDLTRRSSTRLPIGPGLTRVLAFLQQERILLGVSCDDRLLRFLDLSTAETVFSLPAPVTLREVLVASNNELIIMVAKSSVEFWAKSGAVGEWELQKDLPVVADAVAIAPDGDWAALASGGTVSVWQRLQRHWKLHWMYRDSAPPFKSLALSKYKLFGLQSSHQSPSGNQIKERSLISWDLGRSTPRDESRRGCAGSSPMLTPDGAWVASIEGGGLRFDSVAERSRFVWIGGDPRTPIVSVHFSPCGLHFAAIDAAGRVRLWPWQRLVNLFIL